jgi:hypothetical protein
MYPLEILKGRNDLRIYWRGPGFSKGPAPSVIYLALSGEESLMLPSINQPVEFLLNTYVNVFSFTLPSHGLGLGNKNAMKVWADKLSQKILRFYIGNRDIRVGTKECFDLLQRATHTAYETGIRSPPIEMIMTPSIGYKGHGTAPQSFQEGAEWLHQKLLKSAGNVSDGTQT